MVRRDKVCCFTGHRNIAQEDIVALEEKLNEVIAMLIKQNVIFFGAGGPGQGRR